MAGRVLVGGGTGFVGRNLVKLLKTEGYDVITISRSAGNAKDIITWDNIKENGIPSGVSSVVNLAGENVLNFSKRWTKSFQEAVYNSRIDSTRTLSNIINEASQKPSSFISISGVGIYPPSISNKYDENYRTETFDYFSKLCIDWENASKLKECINCSVANVRSGVVLGRDGGMIKDLYLPFKLGLGGPIGSGEQYLPWIHIDDLTNLILFCMKNKIAGKLNGVAPDNISNKRFSTAFGKALSRPALIPVPEFVFNIIFGKERAKMVTQGQCVVPKRTLELGFKYKYSDIQSACNSFNN